MKKEPSARGEESTADKARTRPISTALKKLTSRINPKRADAIRRIGALLWRLVQSYCAGATACLIFDQTAASPLSIILSLLFFWLLGEKRQETNPIAVRAANLIAIFFAFACVLFRYEEVSAFWGTFSKYMALMLVQCWIFFRALLRLLFIRCATMETQLMPSDSCKCKPWLAFGVSFLVIFGCWLVLFLDYYPGIIVADTRMQLAEIVRLDPFSNRNPIVNTQLMRLFFDAGLRLFGNQTDAAALTCLVQMAALAAVAAFLIATMERFSVKRIASILSLVFFAICPVNACFGITLGKDAAFAASVLLLLVCVWRLMVFFDRNELNAKQRIFDYVLLFVAAFCVCAMRNNGVYLMIPFLLVALLLLRKKLRIVILLCTLGMLTAVGVRSLLIDRLDAQEWDIVESVSTPLHHVVGVLAQDLPITDEQHALLSQAMDVSQAAAYFQPNDVDGTKDLVRGTGDASYIESHLVAFIKLWVQLGLQYPKEYALSHINLTYGYWYPEFREFRYTLGVPETSRLDIVSSSKLAASLQGALSDRWLLSHGTPLLGLLFCIGFTTWILVAFLGIYRVRGCRKEFLLILMPLLLIFTLILGAPMNNEFRYGFPAFFSLPLACLAPFLHASRD